MMYLASNSRPLITFDVHQCARYLEGTRSDGLIIKPNMKKMLQVNCFADAYFAGLFSVEDLQDDTSVRSRSGYVLTFVGCLILWVSKLQTK
eukprot:8403043-Ditylum_brightwellii.AAC.1